MDFRGETSRIEESILGQKRTIWTSRLAKDGLTGFWVIVSQSPKDWEEVPLRWSLVDIMWQFMSSKRREKKGGREEMRITKGQIFKFLIGKTKDKRYFIVHDRLYLGTKRKYPKGNGNTELFKAMIRKYKGLKTSEKKEWQEVAKNHHFMSSYQAYCSSFLLFIKRIGMIRALERRVPYIESRTKIQRDTATVRRIQGFLEREPEGRDLLTTDDTLWIEE